MQSRILARSSDRKAALRQANLEAGARHLQAKPVSLDPDTQATVTTHSGL